jgi:plastocyanin
MRRWITAPALALAVVATACGGAERSGDVHAGTAGPDAVRVTLHDDEFTPATLKLPAGEEVTVEITNEGSNAHNFTVDRLDLSTGTKTSGDVMTATFTAPDGTTGFHCTFHPGMTGTIVAT